MSGIFSDKSILIIDDDVRMLHALEKVFSREGASVIGVDLAVDAFKVLAARPRKYDLLITDLRMPFVSGTRTVSIVHDVLPELPIIVLTAFGDPEVKAECLRKGATAWKSSRKFSALKKICGRIKQADLYEKQSQLWQLALPDWHK